MAGRDWRRGIHRRAAFTRGQMDRATYRRVADCRLRVSDEIREQPISAGYVTPAARPGDLVRRLSEIIRLDSAQFVVQSIRHPLISIATNASNKTRLSQKVFFPQQNVLASVVLPHRPGGPKLMSTTSFEFCG